MRVSAFSTVCGLLSLFVLTTQARPQAQTEESLRLSITSAKSTYEWGESILVTYRIDNRSNELVFVNSSLFQAVGANVTVHGPDGKQVRSGRRYWHYPYPTVLGPEYLSAVPPGGFVGISADLQEHFPESLVRTAATHNFDQSGVYEIVAHYENKYTDSTVELHVPHLGGAYLFRTHPRRDQGAIPSEARRTSNCPAFRFG